ncbi:acyl-CoA desaturase [Acinetobacter colistiniresistens]|uniref:Acyl-CoA desaturase n=1 Tax=Acinetobacter colistiniresistens TaxID=280145 RepID=S3TA64_9GAMM|nr:acyl-CoA desaturase [Acinetobacter colistiniresistens]EPG37818.1 stearoyl-CoA desaturase (delta-9 desaturase) [Acinetobacter colistiniresistens]TVT77687.1 acyl-CoA desaturase [Acinetobacter colistiniresistens]
MFKFFLGWIDSWSNTNTLESNQVDRSKIVKDTQVQWLRIIPFILLHIACLAVFWVGVSWFAIIFMIIFYLVRMFAITAFFHRYLSHKTFQTSRPVQFIFLLIGTMSAQRGPLWWAAHHRYHHHFTDTEQDPHSSLHGFWYSHVGWFLNEQNFSTRKEVIKDWLKFPEIIWLDRFNLPIVLMTAFAIYVFGEWLAVAHPNLGTSGLQLLVWGFVISTVLLIHATLCINSLAHLYGSRDFDTTDNSRNNLFLSIITLGEGWHNNHHYYAGSTRQGFFWWQIDITYYVLKAMSWLGLIWGIKPVPQRIYAAYNSQKQSLKMNPIKTQTKESS